MKLNVFKALATSAVVLSASSVAFSQTTIRVVGSTAFRKAFNDAVANLVDFSDTANGDGVAFNGTSMTAATNMCVVGKLKSAAGVLPAGSPVVIQTAFVGSVGGVKTITNDLDISAFIKTSVAAGKTTATGQNTDYTDANNVETDKATVTMSDTTQGTTPFKSPSLTASKLGVVTFAWAVGPTSPLATANAGGPVNMTSLLAQAILVGGVPYSQVVGATAATGDDHFVFALGRDQDSGTRVAALADSGFGVARAPLQFQVLPADGASTITEIRTYPAKTVLGTDYANGTSGYTGGGDVAKALKQTDSAGAISVFDDTDYNPDDAINHPRVEISTDGAYLVGYLGVGDTSGLTLLNYNGVPYSTDAVKDGRYTFWTYEWMMYKSTLDTNSKALATAIRNNIATTTYSSAGGVALGDMLVTRTVEGALVN